MYSTRTTAIAAGVFFLITHVTSIVAVLLYAPALADPLAGDPNAVLLGTVLDSILAFTVVGTAVALYPIVRRVSEGFAVGYVALRTLESSVILAGVVMLMAAMAVRTTSPEVAAGFVAVYQQTFIVGPGFVCAVNTVVLAWVLYRSRLVPRVIPILGLIGGPVILAVNLSKAFGTFDAISSWASVGVVPIFAWEISLAIYLIAKGPRDRSREGLVRAAG